jgi:hypothetical protein
MTLAPAVAGKRPGAIPHGTFSVNGQRPSSNEFKVDGVNANFGIVPGGETPGTSGAGNTLALTASGGANGIASVGSTQEVDVKTSALEPEYGRVAGAQVEIATKAGTNNFHGSVFHFFGNDALDASDWFANSRSLKQPPKRLNVFGATFGGPLKKDHTFFFGSYEGLRLRQPMVGITDVPSLGTRAAAPSGMRSLLEVFPVPNGVTRSDGFAEFSESFANPARHDVGSINLYQAINDRLVFRGRYAFADSDAFQRGAGGFSLNTTNRIHNQSQSVTGAVVHTVSSTIVAELRANYSRARVNGSYALDQFGGATPPIGVPTASSFSLDLIARNAAWMFGDEQSNLQRQLNVNGAMITINGNHTFKFGADYRRLSPKIAFRSSDQTALFDGAAQAITGIPT